MEHERMCIRDAGIIFGYLPRGPNNAITDVEGVGVGHTTARGAGNRRAHCTEWGHDDHPPPGRSLLRTPLYAAVSVFNGYGEMTGNIVIDEWGLLGSPIMLTHTVSIRRVYDATPSTLQPAVWNGQAARPVQMPTSSTSGPGLAATMRFTMASG